MDNLEIRNSVSHSPRTSRSLQEGHGRILSKFTDHDRVGPAIKQNPERDSTRGCTSACQATRELSASKSQNFIPTAVMLSEERTSRSEGRRSRSIPTHRAASAPVRWYFRVLRKQNDTVVPPPYGCF